MRLGGLGHPSKLCQLAHTPAELATLPVLVDALDAGVVVPNKARRVQFANRALWRSGERFRPGDIK
jgi:hypothetical protein